MSDIEETQARINRATEAVFKAGAEYRKAKSVCDAAERVLDEANKEFHAAIKEAREKYANAFSKGGES